MWLHANNFPHPLQVHMSEIRQLHGDKHRLAGENRELRELACFLDDERHKAKKMSKDWQRFGRHANIVMKQVGIRSEQTTEIRRNCPRTNPRCSRSSAISCSWSTRTCN